MIVGILGGAFNPPHNGHLMIARQVLDYTDVHEVWFLPNYGQIPPKPVADVVHRMAMTRLLRLNKTKVSALEVDNMLDGDTINLLPLLPKKNTYRFIVGSDQLSTFHMWGQWQVLLKKLPFLVFPRYGYPNEPLYQNMTVVTHKDLVGSNLSSTKVRNRIAAGLSIGQFVPKEIAEYIHLHKLYL